MGYSDEKKVIKSVQADFDQERIKNALVGYKPISNNKIKDVITPGDMIRYFSNGQFRMGGAVKQVNLEKGYIVLMNMSNRNLTWCVQLAKPDIKLKLYIKSKDEIKKKNDDMKKIFNLYNQGKLQLVNNKC